MLSITFRHRWYGNFLRVMLFLITVTTGGDLIDMTRVTATAIPTDERAWLSVTCITTRANRVVARWRWQVW